MNSSFDAAVQITDNRLQSFPDSHLFLYAQKELNRINSFWDDHKYFDMPFYDSINIGVMCARELEAVDPEYCDIIYSALEDIRLKASRHA